MSILLWKRPGVENQAMVSARRPARGTPGCEAEGSIMIAVWNLSFLSPLHCVVLQRRARAHVRPALCCKRSQGTWARTMLQPPTTPAGILWVTWRPSR